MKNSRKKIENNVLTSIFLLVNSIILLERERERERERDLSGVSRAKVSKKQSVGQRCSTNFSSYLTHYFIPIGSYVLASDWDFFVPKTLEKYRKMSVVFAK